MATYRASEDLISIGAYQPGANPSLDRAVTMMPYVKALLCQSSDDATTLDDALQGLMALFGQAPQGLAA
jgi:flagellum-specific ATP synthase